MIEDVYEPLSRYRDEFKEKFARIAQEKFAELTRISGVDIQANAVLIRAIKKLQADREQLQNTRALWALLTTILILLAIASGVILFLHFSGETEIPEYLSIASVFVIVLAPLTCFLKTIPAYRELDQQIAKLTRLIDSKIAEAWAQMAPLNALFDWSITSELIEKTVPRLQFDRYFTESRLSDLRKNFDWDDSLTDERSVIHSHSGVINGNPFVFAELRRQDWHDKAYTGYLPISWTETVRDADGKYRRVRRHETLTATIYKPAPYYCNEKVLIFGNEAAPDLTFSRHPSDLSGAEAGIWNSIKNVFSKVGEVIGNAITNTVKKAINGVLSTAVSIINGFIKAINIAISVINAIPGVNINKLNELSVPKLARGGIIDSATLAVVGEQGKEAVVPLENNTEWLDELAKRLAVAIGADNDRPIILQVDGKTFAKTAVSSINTLTRQQGRLSLNLV